MEHASAASPLIGALIFLGAAVVAGPLARRFGLGVAVGYLIAGVIIGPAALALIQDPGAVLQVAEIGVVMLLFLIGLELRIERLIALRRLIIGFGGLQILLTGTALAGVAWAAGLKPPAAIAVGIALAFSGTAMALRILQDRGHLNRPYGERTFAVLLAQDLAVVPALALVPMLGDGPSNHATDWMQALASAAVGAGALAAIVVAGRYLLNPLFRLLAGVGAREVMTAAALLVVLGAAEISHAAGMSMALGAFLAGVLLAGSSYRLELEADVEPFRGLLIALFFMGIGMTIDMRVVAAHFLLLPVAVIGYLALKVVIAGALARLFGSPLPSALRIGGLLAGAGEFAFVLAPLSASEGLINGETASLLSALAALSLMAAPALVTLCDRLATRLEPHVDGPTPDYTDAKGQVLVIGFGRVGQIAAQLLLAEGVETTLIDANAARVEQAAKFGFKVYYGDGSRLDVLRAVKADEARAIVVCIDDQETTRRVVETLQKHFPLAQLVVKAYDRGHALDLYGVGVENVVRETFESALVLGRLALEAVGVDPERAAEIEGDVRLRDLQRLQIQKVEGITAGRHLAYTNRPTPEPLSQPRRKGQKIDGEAAADGPAAGAPAAAPAE
ncbi:monovalent cation:proton antiporter-2 (CPA2) family protein [Hansschlegelia sp.]|uniref:monovalent cation:proton antiporter-2 (CPA2) family protein n=1 Tax=Hansschlegelia sp. TaxID=2041892 RepID=UPI002B98BF7A|nr:monovalent cation:proton antiporter-2 (CPA2) family protein [Hansschlegelia sp.]HVI30067.1 monovalent cation:proton antiporter-2 (CPA2) family protein [Hansschlegelia sp.]